MTEVEKANFLLEVFMRDCSHLRDENLLLLRNDFLWKWRTKGKGKGFFKKELRILLCRTRRAQNFFSISNRFGLQLGLRRCKPPSCHEQHCLRGSVEIGGGFGGDRWRGGKSHEHQSKHWKNFKALCLLIQNPKLYSLLMHDVSVAEFV